MDGEPSKSSQMCQTDIQKICIICDQKKNLSSMRILPTPLNLYIFVAYLRFACGYPSWKDFSDCEGHKNFLVCAVHVEPSARAIRKIYSFTPLVRTNVKKYDPMGLIRNLQRLMPKKYQTLSVSEMGSAIAISTLPETTKCPMTDCCALLEQTRRRLNHVINMSVRTPDSVQMKYPIFYELVEMEKTLHEEIIKNCANVTSSSDSIDAACRKEEHFLLSFEKNRSVTDHHRIAIRPCLKSSNPNTVLEELHTDENDMPDLKKEELAMTSDSRKRKQLTETNAPIHSKKLAKGELLASEINKLRCSSPYHSQQTFECAKAIMNSKLVVFSLQDVRELLHDVSSKVYCSALSKLASSGLLHTDVRHVPPRNQLVIVYLKEFRRGFMEELWNFGIIPEHYRQRTIGIASGPTVRYQLEKNMNALMSMNLNPLLNDLISTILTDSKNSDLGVLFEKNKPLQEKTNFLKSRTPKIQPLSE